MSILQKTINETLIKEEHNKSTVCDSEPFKRLQDRTRGQKAIILEMLKHNDRVSVGALSNVAGQYNARVNELNKELSKLNLIIESHYDFEEGIWYKRMEDLK